MFLSWDCIHIGLGGLQSLPDLQKRKCYAQNKYRGKIFQFEDIFLVFQKP
jgi:hypothetical protein